MESANSPNKPQSFNADLRTLRQSLPLLWPPGKAGLKVRVVVSLMLLAAAKGINVGVPLLYKQAVDILSAQTAMAVALPVALLVGYGLMRLLGLVCAELQHYVFIRVGQRAIRLSALRVFRHLHRLSLDFHLDRQTGGLNRAIERGTKGIEFLLRFMLFSVGPTLLEILLVCGILWQLYNIWYALVTFITVGGYAVWTISVTEWRIKHRRKMNQSDQDASTKAIDSLLNYETVKYFNNEEHEARRFESALRAYENASIKSRASLTLLNIGQGAFIAAGLTVIMLMAAKGVVDGTMTVGDFVLVNSYLIQLFLPLNFLGFVYREIKQALTDLEEMFGLLEQRPKVADDDGAPALAAGPGEVRFDNVSFAYDPRRQVITDLSFRIPAGKTLAVVGASGAGKSTLSRLLFRFYDVSAGRVLIDGQDVRRVTQDSLRAAFGVVPQDTVLFNDSIYYNIEYGHPGAPPEDVYQAARLARIDDFVRALPDQYDTVVGERGLKLSGGEKQRVAIARTILKNPRILVFDEATSALDSHTEKEIQDSLDAASADSTTLIIAHRLSTVIHADEIIVLEQGRIVETGTHASLLADGGLYARMWRRQREAAQARRILADTESGAAPQTN